MHVGVIKNGKGNGEQLVYKNDGQSITKGVYLNDVPEGFAISLDKEGFISSCKRVNNLREGFGDYWEADLTYKYCFYINYECKKVEKIVKSGEIGWKEPPHRYEELY